jgi:hypothetical protein
MQTDSKILSWLLEGDHSIRWQVQRDLLDEPPQVYEAERERIAETGWGAQLLALQEPDGRWGGGLYSPKWISTTYSLLALRILGLPAANHQAQIGCRLLLEHGLFPDGGINYFSHAKHSETCITGMVLSILAHFRYPDPRVHNLVEHLLRQQMVDGGWNCRSYRGDTHSSFHTTLSVLEGLLAYEKLAPPDAAAVSGAQARGRKFLLQHKLYRSHRSGEVVSPAMTRFPFPPRWQYDVLRALDYFQSVNAPRDECLEDPIALLMSKRKADGRWQAYRGPSGQVFFEMELAGKPGRANTLRALRVLRWWQGKNQTLKVPETFRV